MNNDYIEEKVNKHESELYGKEGKLGLAHKVAVMWSAHVWILCTLSATLGFVVRPWIETLVGKH